MDTIPEDEVCRLRTVLRALSAGAAVVHCALCAYCVARAVQAPALSPQRVALYHARVSFGAPVAQGLQRAYKHTCAAAPSNASGPLILHVPNKTTLTWLPQRATAPAADAVDGFALLAALFLVSCAAQCFYTYTTFAQQALETFRQPCLVRWLEYAATAPLQVALVAACVLVRDLHTLGLLAAAQTACVLVGFALEYALGTRDLEDPLDQTLMARSPPSLAAGLELRIGTIVCGPSVDDRCMRTHAEKAQLAWHVCFTVASQLHVAVWAVLLSQLVAVEASAACDAPRAADAWQRPLRLLVLGQFALFSALWLVPPLQWLATWAGKTDAPAALLYGSVAHAVLGVVAKAMLLATYVEFVQLFPFAAVESREN